MDFEEIVEFLSVSSIILLLVFVFLPSIFVPIWGSSNGSYTGYVTAVETSGVIWQTNSAYVKTDLTSSNEDKFCFLDESLFEVLKEKSTKKEKMTITYSNPLIVWAWDCKSSDSSIITKVE